MSVKALNLRGLWDECIASAQLATCLADTSSSPVRRKRRQPILLGPIKACRATRTAKQEELGTRCHTILRKDRRIASPYLARTFQNILASTDSMPGTLKMREQGLCSKGASSRSYLGTTRRRERSSSFRRSRLWSRLRRRQCRRGRQVLLRVYRGW